MKIDIINGPNLNLIGQRQPEIYGQETFDEVLEKWRTTFSVELNLLQNNVEGELVNLLHASSADGIIINAGAYTHTSIALRDAIAGIKKPVIEVHMSNVAGRESFRHESFLTPVCMGCVFGFGMDSYRLAIDQLIHHLRS
ncbi:MAG: type II 3-dehydroquinate dehydratase [Crocinitomicaceae bacterium]|jgi:3-dehydroquinate dehydratase-2|nr:type II 3-dehydroquinate dehydratase [Crocinitomicaceae bacterium]